MTRKNPLFVIATSASAIALTASILAPTANAEPSQRPSHQERTTPAVSHIQYDEEPKQTEQKAPRDLPSTQKARITKTSKAIERSKKTVEGNVVVSSWRTLPSRAGTFGIQTRCPRVERAVASSLEFMEQDTETRAYVPQANPVRLVSVTTKETLRGRTFTTSSELQLTAGPSLRVRQTVECIRTTIPGKETPLQNPTKNQIAAAIYSQAMGLGLGEVAAYMGIGVAISETGLTNNATGDCWTASPQCSLGRTGSRGIFQQFAQWTPPGLAWSGKQAPTGGYGTDYSMFNPRNAWTDDGWAWRDPRMNVHQAANMFFLGPNYLATAGLEDDHVFRSVRDRNPESLDANTVFTIAHNVQGFPIAHRDSYISNFFGTGWGKSALSYLKDIKEGRIAVPPFVLPHKGMYKSATTGDTKKALGID